MKLETPLYKKQIEAADKLRQYLEGWKLSDTALNALNEKLPGFESHVCMLKCVAVNAIYGTNVVAILKLRSHVESVLHKHDLSKAGPDLVDEIAKTPKDMDGKSRTRTSFASKFCHFFICAERFPIYDDAAREALKLHFGKRVKPHHYKSFHSCISQLKESAGFECSVRTIDHYLWLTGMYLRSLKANPKINSELLALFKNPSIEQKIELDALLPSQIQRTFSI
jgi:hypothetical protein